MKNYINIEGISFIEEIIHKLNKDLSLISNDKLQFNKDINDESEFNKHFNKTINTYVEDKPGVYIWTDDNNNIIYIGVAGTINKLNQTKHTLKNRLKASRGYNKSIKKYITTNRFIYHLLRGKYIVDNKYDITLPTEGFNTISIHYVVTPKEIPASYMESYLLYQYYIKENSIPILNNSF